MQKVNKVILHLTSLEHGGAAQFTFNYHRQMLAEGNESYVAVRGTKCLYPDGTWHKIKQSPNNWEKIKRYVFRKSIQHTCIDKQYSMYNLCERFTCHSAKDTLAALPKKPDVIYVHWVSDYVNAKFLRDIRKYSGAEIVLIMVDHALYSGGCHYPGLCDGYKKGCADCPASTSVIVKNAVRRNMLFKQKYLPKDCIIIYANTGEDVINLAQSTLYKNIRVEKHIIQVDAAKYAPCDDKAIFRRKWNVPLDKKIVFFGSSHLDEPRKGMRVLIEALAKVKAQNVFFVVAGGRTLPLHLDNMMIVGYLNEEELIEMYQMSDMFVCPSLADAGPMMVNQSLMCGLPVVSFPVGVSVDLVKTGDTGYLAHFNDSNDLANGIDYISSLSYEEYLEISRNCRDLALRMYAK